MKTGKHRKNGGKRAARKDTRLENLEKGIAAVVRREGDIFLNQERLLSPGQWAYGIVHCQLHLAFGHFDGEKMPGLQRRKG